MARRSPNSTNTSPSAIARRPTRRSHAGHGGGDFFLVEDFVDAIRRNRRAGYRRLSGVRMDGGRAPERAVRNERRQIDRNARFPQKRNRRPDYPPVSAFKNRVRHSPVGHGFVSQKVVQSKLNSSAPAEDARLLSARRQLSLRRQPPLLRFDFSQTWEKTVLLRPFHASSSVRQARSTQRPRTRRRGLFFRNRALLCILLTYILPRVFRRFV